MVSAKNRLKGHTRRILKALPDSNSLGSKTLFRNASSDLPFEDGTVMIREKGIGGFLRSSSTPRVELTYFRDFRACNFGFKTYTARVYDPALKDSVQGALDKICNEEGVLYELKIV